MNKLKKLQMNLRGAQKKTSAVQGLSIVNSARSDFSATTLGSIMPNLYEIKVANLQKFLPRKLDLWSQIQRSPSLSEISLEKELDWAMLNIKQNSDLLSRFRIHVEKLQDSYLRDDAAECRGILEILELECGKSLWLARAVINIAAVFEGLEAQKAKSREFLHASPRSITSFLSWYVSERNEEKVSLSGFVSRIEEVLPIIPSEEMLATIRWELLDAFPKDEKGITSLLRAHAASSIIDYYECFIRIMIDILEEAHSGRMASARMIDALLETARHLKDNRLSKYLPIAKREDSVTTFENKEHSRFQIAKGVDRALVTAALCGQKILEPVGPVAAAINELYAVATRDPSRDKSFSRLEKFVMNAAFLPVSSSMKRCMERRSISCSPIEAFVERDEFQDLNEEEEVKVARYIDIFEVGADISVDLNIIRELNNTPAAERLLFCERIRLHADRLAITQDDDRSVDLVSECIIHFPTMAREFDLRGLSIRLTSNIKRWAKRPRTAIIFNYLIESATDPSLESRLQLLVKWTLDDSESLQSVPLARERGAWIHFLRQVCLQKNLTLLAEVTHSSDLRTKRMQICRRLLELDSGNSSKYEDEIKQLTLDQMKEDGVHIFDQSRVYVNVEGLLSIAARQYTESLERFKALRKLPQGAAANDREIALRDLLPRSPDSDELIRSSKVMSESREVFISLLNGLATLYLSDPNNGLDSYLSLRIRHGSMASSIRGPLEEAQLVTTRGPSLEAAAYERNTHWLEKLCAGLDYYEDDIDSLLRNFSKQVDGMITETIAKYLQVLSPLHPHGVFKLSLLEVEIEHLSEVGVRKTSTEFFDECFSIFGIAMTPCLERMQTIIQQEIKYPIDLLLTAMAVSVEETVGAIQASTFVHVVNQTRIAVQQAADKVTSWFQLGDSIKSGQTFAIEELVAICVAVAKNTHSGFSPTIVTHLSESDRRLTVMSHMMHSLSDAIFIMIDNVYKHAGLTSSPSINLTIRLIDRTRLEILCISPINLEHDKRQAMDIKLEDIRQRIRAASFADSVNQEGGTGLFKLRKLAGDLKLPDGEEPLSFGFGSAGDFFVSLFVPVRIQ